MYRISSILPWGRIPTYYPNYVYSLIPPVGTNVLSSFLHVSTVSSVSSTTIPLNFRKLDHPSVQQFMKKEKARTTNFMSKPAFAKWRLRIYHELEAYHRYQSLPVPSSSSSSSRSSISVNPSSDHDETDSIEYPIGAEQFGSYLYYCVAHEHRDFPVWYRQCKDNFRNVKNDKSKQSKTTPPASPAEIEVLDTYILAKYGKHQFANIGTLKPSLDLHQRYVAWTVDLDGSETYHLFIRDMMVPPLLSKILPSKFQSSSSPSSTAVSSYPWLPNEIIPNAVNFVWLPYTETSSSTLSRPGFFYTVANPSTKRAYKVLFHEIGTDYRNDTCLYEEKDESKFVDIAISKDQQLITIQINDRDISEVYILHYQKNNQPIPYDTTTNFGHSRYSLCVLSRREQIQYFLEHQNGHLMMVTNAQGADNYKIMCCDIRKYLTSSSSSSVPSLGMWQNLYVPDSATRILDVDIFSSFLVIYERSQGVSRIKVLFTDTLSGSLRIKEERTIPLPSHTSGIDPGTNANTFTDTLRFTAYSSTAPERDYEYNIGTHQLRTLNHKIVGQVKDVPIYNPLHYTSYTITVPSYDIHDRSFVQVPLTLVHHRGLKISEDTIKQRATELGKEWQSQADMHERILRNDYTATWKTIVKKDDCFFWDRCEKDERDTASTFTEKVQSFFRNSSTSLSSPPYPTLFHVYGAYGHDQDTHFSTNRLPLLQRNWILAFAHVRGGKENGANWYYNGRGARKLNSMYDTLACLHMLIALGLTDASSLACRTESAGSVIGGWLSNHYPTLLRSHIFRSPFLDVLTAMSDPSLPLTVPEYQEWGNPVQDKRIANYIAGYSPVQTVPVKIGKNEKGQILYPNLYIDTSVTDTRVPVWHALSFIDKLRTRIEQGRMKEISNDTNVNGSEPFIISQIHEQGSGHFGPSGRSSRMQDRAKELTFLLSTVGREKKFYRKGME